VVTIGGALLALTGNSGPAPSGSLASPPGLNLRANAAKAMLRPIADNGALPSYIVDALVVPAGARSLGITSPANSLDLYDASVSFAVPASVETLVAFYRYELTHDHWTVSDVVAGTNGGTNLYAIHPSADGYDWEAGVLITPSNGALSSALGGGSPPSASSSVELRLLERGDAA
jgi:hypothetical protein